MTDIEEQMIAIEEQIDFLKCELQHLEFCQRHNKQFIPLLVPGMPDHAGKTPDEIKSMIDELKAR